MGKLGRQFAFLHEATQHPHDGALDGILTDFLFRATVSNLAAASVALVVVVLPADRLARNAHALLVLVMVAAVQLAGEPKAQLILRFLPAHLA